MTPQKTRLLLAATLFAAWIGYLLYLVVTLPRSPNELPIVLSRPQILVSRSDVVGTIDLKDGTVKVQEVLFPPNGKKPAKGDGLKVTNLGEVKPALEGQKIWDVSGAAGNAGRGHNLSSGASAAVAGILAWRGTHLSGDRRDAGGVSADSEALTLRLAASHASARG